MTHHLPTAQPRPLLLAAALALALLTGPAAAQAQAPELGTYRAFGEQPGLARLMDDFLPRLLADARTAGFFKPANPSHLKAQLAAQFCQLLGGPCVYDGPDMKSAHQDLTIGKADFNALVEILQQSMDAQGVPFGAQNRLLARLAPMHRDIITAR